MRRKLVVGKVEFLKEGSTLSYWPTTGARVYQAVAAVGISIVSGYVAFIIAKHKPLGDLIGANDRWNTAAALAFAIFSVGLLFSIPMYLRGSAGPLILDAKRKCLRVGRTQLRDLSLATVVTIHSSTGFAGEYSSVPSWSVSIKDNGKDYYLPFLEFESQEEASLVAKEISGLFGLTVST